MGSFLQALASSSTELSCQRGNLSSIKSIKYILKYVHKGTDPATFSIQGNGEGEEIKSFVNARYTGSTEDAWRIFQIPMLERSPSVVHLALQLESGRHGNFTEHTAAVKQQQNHQ
ncbi:hypothetical protein RRG08_031269 [Elysia crispata]|uniref:Uncharacterized protein n=1 Tax=Elysia crispata TaxID=231223 RepID=A0AAE1AJ70_9GAST|nr:hypothetical protein RRG08_031269 [Elysia crispata]